MKVVDCTVLADFYVGEPPCRRAAHALLQQDPEWVSVGYWRYEFGNVLLKYVRSGRLNVSDMEAALAQAGELVQGTVHEVSADQIWALALEKGLSYYDASYVWLARKQDMPLYTRDGGILSKCPEYSQPMPTAGLG
jgi:predicted nucleic acid-binding protein